jgi:hypothetical protein
VDSSEANDRACRFLRKEAPESQFRLLSWRPGPVPTVIILILIVLATLTWWLYTIKPTSFTLKASVLKLLSLEFEMKRPEELEREQHAPNNLEQPK